MLGRILYLQDYSSDLLDHGIETTAESVRLTVYPGKGDPLVDDITVTFTTSEGQHVKAVLWSEEDAPQGMPEGEQVPAAGTRYAMPLAILYDPVQPTRVLASVDAREWTADRKTPVIGASLLIGGAVLVILAAILLTRGARRRGLAWYRWYSDAPSG